MCDLCNQLVEKIREKDFSVARSFAAVRTLERMNYTYHGGDQWKPPLGPSPNFTIIAQKEKTIESLRATNTELHKNIDTLRRAINDQQQELANKNAELARQRTEIHAMSVKLDYYEGAICDTYSSVSFGDIVTPAISTRKVLDVLRENDRLRKDNVDLDNTASAFRTRCEMLERRCHELETKLRETRKMSIEATKAAIFGPMVFELAMPVSSSLSDAEKLAASLRGERDTLKKELNEVQRETLRAHAKTARLTLLVRRCIAKLRKLAYDRSALAVAEAVETADIAENTITGM